MFSKSKDVLLNGIVFYGIDANKFLPQKMHHEISWYNQDFCKHFQIIEIILTKLEFCYVIIFGNLYHAGSFEGFLCSKF